MRSAHARSNLNAAIKWGTDQGILSKPDNPSGLPGLHSFSDVMSTWAPIIAVAAPAIGGLAAGAGAEAGAGGAAAGGADAGGNAVFGGGNQSVAAASGGSQGGAALLKTAGQYLGVAKDVGGLAIAAAGLISGKSGSVRPGAVPTPDAAPASQAAQMPDEAAARMQNLSGSGDDTLLTGPRGVDAFLLNLGRARLLGN